MKIVNADAAFMARRREKLLPGWWIMNVVADEFLRGHFCPAKPRSADSIGFRGICNAEPFDLEKALASIKEL